MHAADVPKFLMAAFPGFHLDYEGREAWHSDYLTVGMFASQAVDAARNGMLDDFPRLFNAVEQGLKAGDEAARTMLVAGFLED